MSKQVVCPRCNSEFNLPAHKSIAWLFREETFSHILTHCANCRRFVRLPISTRDQIVWQLHGAGRTFVASHPNHLVIEELRRRTV